MEELTQMIKDFFEDYKTAPLYGGYSRNLKKKIQSKSQVQNEFIENIQMLGRISCDKVVTDKITSILKGLE